MKLTKSLERIIACFLIVMLLASGAVFADDDPAPNTGGSEGGIENTEPNDNGESSENGEATGTSEKPEPAQPASQATPKPEAPKAKIAKNGGNLYYVDAKGRTRKKAGFVKLNGKLYYVKKGGKLAKGKTLSLKRKKYHINKNGVVQVGVHKWGKYYYYSNSKGQLITKAKFVTWKKNKYYIRKSGRIQTAKTFTVKKKKYRARKDGTILTGLYKSGGKLYYSDPGTGEWIRKEGFKTVGGHKYFIRSGGEVIQDEIFVSKDKVYEADSKGRCRSVELPPAEPHPVVISAQAEVGTKTGKKYWTWYFGSSFVNCDITPWCGTFVAWCYNDAGRYSKVTPIKSYGNLGYVPSYSIFASRRGKWVKKTEAKGGDIVVFGDDAHVGIVEMVHNGYLFTIEGNTGPTAAIGSGKPGAVCRKAYKLDNKRIKGIIRP